MYCMHSTTTCRCFHLFLEKTQRKENISQHSSAGVFFPSTTSQWLMDGSQHGYQWALATTYGTNQWCHSRAYCWHHTTMKVAGRCNASPHWGPSLYSCHCNLTKTKKEKYRIDLNLVKILLLSKHSLVFPCMQFVKFMSSCRAILDKHAAIISDHGVSYWNSWCFEAHQQWPHYLFSLSLQLLCFFLPIDLRG